jgi:SAM-dependent methyltransferase
LHLSSKDKMKLFKERYLSGQEGRDLSIFDLGSMAIGGSYRDIFSEARWRYTGLDLTKGENVDLVLSDPYNWLEIDSESVDILVSGQAFEHIEYFWETMREIARILKPGGLCCIIAPSGGPEHKYPLDCWRFYPDGFRALSRYAGLELLEVTTQWKAEGYSDGSDMWHDTMFVGRKPDRKPKDVEDEHVYERAIEENSEDSLGRIIRHIAPGSKVLELGPATGYLTRFLKEKKGCSVDCVEISAKMAKEAENFSDRMIVGDLDTLVLEEEFPKQSYDCIILADVLEHLKKDAKTLKSCRNLLKKNGYCILSIPNIAHASIIGELLQGRFEYTDEGLLDRSHCRFYTCSSIQRLINECGFSVKSIEPITKLPEDTEIGDSLKRFPVEVQKAILSTPESLSYQFVIVCCPVEEKTVALSIERLRTEQQAIDLRRLVITGFEARIKESENELAIAQKLAYERLEYIKDLEKAFHEAQRFAFERLDLIKDYEKNILNTIWTKIRNTLGRYR